MADKESTVYIVDVGSSMGANRNGRTESSLDWAMSYVWEKITSTVGKKVMILGEKIILILPGSPRTKDSYSWCHWAPNGW